MKIAVSIFSFLAVLIGTVLFMQFQVYSDEVGSVDKGYNYSQEIEIVYRGKAWIFGNISKTCRKKS